MNNQLREYPSTDKSGFTLLPQTTDEVSKGDVWGSFPKGHVLEGYCRYKVTKHVGHAIATVVIELSGRKLPVKYFARRMNLRGSFLEDMLDNLIIPPCKKDKYGKDSLNLDSAVAYKFRQAVDRRSHLNKKGDWKKCLPR